MLPAPDSSIRIATPPDAPALAQWLQANWPQPALADRSRRAMLDHLLARPELGACVIAESDGRPRACLPAQLAPHLGLHGLVAQVTEWWSGAAHRHESGADFAACLAALADWCAAHGIRHMLLAPDLPVDPDRCVRHASGLWQIGIAPAPKSLG